VGVCRQAAAANMQACATLLATAPRQTSADGADAGRRRVKARARSQHERGDVRHAAPAVGARQVGPEGRRGRGPPQSRLREVGGTRLEAPSFWGCSKIFRRICTCRENYSHGFRDVKHYQGRLDGIQGSGFRFRFRVLGSRFRLRVQALSWEMPSCQVQGYDFSFRYALQPP